MAPSFSNLPFDWSEGRGGVLGGGGEKPELGSLRKALPPAPAARGGRRGTELLPEDGSACSVPSMAAEPEATLTLDLVRASWPGLQSAGAVCCISLLPLTFACGLRA